MSHRLPCFFICALLAANPLFADPDSGESSAILTDPEALFAAGRACDKGEGTPQNLAKAAEYFRKAAEAGHLKSQVNLGTMYVQGRGVR